MFILLKNKTSEDQRSYYSYSFSIFENNIKKEEKEEKDDNNKLTLILVIIGLFIFIVVILIIFFVIYRNIKQKNKNLEEKVNTISFSKEKEEDEEIKEIEESFI